MQVQMPSEWRRDTSAPPELKGDFIVIRQIMLPTSLKCTACGLTISGHAALHAVDLGGQFTATSYYDPVTIMVAYSNPRKNTKRVR